MIRGTNRWAYVITKSDGTTAEGIIEHDGDWPTPENGVVVGYPRTHELASGMRQGDIIELTMVSGQDYEPWKGGPIVRKMICDGVVSEPVKVKWRGSNG